VIARRTSGANMVGWFVGSLLPWVACWSAPVSLWWLVPCGAVAIGYAFWLYRSVARSDRLQHQGIPARGVVLEVVRPLMNVVINKRLHQADA
jgi:hypothetical protein